MKNILPIILKLCISLALLGYFLTRINLNLLTEEIINFPKGILIFICLLYLVPQIINTFKWRLLLPHHSFYSLFQMTILSTYYSLVLPGQIAGEGIKAYKLGKGKQDAEQVAASVAVDKITAFIGLLLVGVFGAFLSLSQIHYGVPIVLCIISALFSLFLFSFHFQTIRDLPEIILYKFFGSSPRTVRLAGQFHSFINAWLAYSRRTRLVLFSILLGVVFQLVVASLTDILARQLGIVVSLLDWCWIMPLNSIAILLPITIGGIGVREGSFITMLGWLHVSDEKALALSLTCFFIQILFAAWGFVFDMNLHLRSMRNRGIREG